MGMGKFEVCMRTVGVALALFLASGTALAQPGDPSGARNYDVKPMSFDIWCQETERLPVERCDQRLSGDVEAFETYRRTVERYEIRYLDERAKDKVLEERILNYDPTRTIREPGD